MTKSSRASRQRGTISWRAVGLAFLMVAVAALPGAGRAEDAQQTMFASPDEAAKAVIDAADKGDTAALLAVFGPQGADLVSSGDPVADKSARERFVALAKQATRLEKVGRRQGDPQYRARRLAAADPDRQGHRRLVLRYARPARRRSSTGGSAATSSAPSTSAGPMSRRSANMPAKDHDGSGVLKFAQQVNSSPESARMASTGPPSRAARSARSGRWSPMRSRRATDQARRAPGRPITATTSRSSRAQGKPAPGRRLRLRHQWQHDRRLRHGRLAGELWRDRAS